jgi:flagellin-like hook-associated protein FlgL
MIKNILLLFMIDIIISGANVQTAFADSSSLTFLNRILNYSEKEEDKSVQRLSGGRILLIDDPANYAIYESLEKFIREFGGYIGNQSDMLSYYRLEDSLMGNIVEILQRIRELSLQRSNGILSDVDRLLVESEMKQQYDQVFMTLENAEFNKKKIFSNLMVTNIISERFESREYYELQNIDRLLDFFIKERASIGAVMNSMEFQISGERIARQNMAEMQSHTDTEFGNELSVLKKRELIMLVNILLLKQSKP